MSVGINRYVDMTGVEPDEMMLPNLDEHRRWIDENGISFFNLPPYSMTQIVIGGDTKTSWYYVDTGHDGHAIRTFDLAKKVLEQTIKWHQEAVLRQLELVKEKKS